jgi:hypothetical protein
MRGLDADELVLTKIPKNTLHLVGGFTGMQALTWLLGSPGASFNATEKTVVLRDGPYAFSRRKLCQSRHCEERSDEAIQTRVTFREEVGLLRGACHRAGHFGPDPLSRNDRE